MPSFSLSNDTDEQRVQRKGYVTAFQSDAVQTAIRQGFIDHIAVTYVAWVGTHSQSLVVSWTAIGTTAEVEKLRRSGRADTPVP